MNISETFPSKYLKAADLQGRRIEVIMADVKTEKLGDDMKPILYFRGKDKGLALNKTNANTIADAYGFETDDWFGQPIVLYEAMVEFQGKRGPAIRVDVPRKQAFTKRSQEPADRIPDREPPPRERQPETVGAGPNYRGELDDDVPFGPEMRG